MSTLPTTSSGIDPRPSARTENANERRIKIGTRKETRTKIGKGTETGTAISTGTRTPSCRRLTAIDIPLTGRRGLPG
jgi:hypothetical protein